MLENFKIDEIFGLSVSLFAILKFILPVMHLGKNLVAYLIARATKAQNCFTPVSTQESSLDLVFEHGQI